MFTKSLYRRGMGCPKALWLHWHQPKEREPMSLGAQARAEEGRRVGQRATEVYPDGVWGWEDGISTEEALLRSQEVLASGADALFEVTVAYEGFLARIDLLLREDGDDGDSWHLIEVKSRKNAEDLDLEELAYQVWVASSAGIKIGRASLQLVDPDDVVLGGFRREDRTGDVARMLDQVVLKAQALSSLAARTDYPSLDGTWPHVDPDLRAGCRDCEFYKHCEHRAPAGHVFHLGLHHSKLKKLRTLGIRTIDEFPDDLELNPVESRRVTATRENRIVLGPQLGEALQRVEYPAFFIDFETLHSRNIEWIRESPTPLVAFQWSCHRLESPPQWLDGRFIAEPIRHDEFLATERDHPNAAFADSLWRVLEAEGSILHYSPHEITVLKQLEQSGDPSAAALLEQRDRFIDLEAIVRQEVAHPGFRGRSSIKVVLPALVPGFGYGDLKIQGGEDAIAGFQALMSDNLDPDQKRALTQHLLAYCKRDTEAMVQVFLALWTLWHASDTKL